MFHARGATAADLRTALADLTGATGETTAPGLLDGLDQVIDRGLDPLEEQGVGFSPKPDGSLLTVIVDAVDEAASRQDRIAIAELLDGLSRRPWARVVVATRPMSPGGLSAPDSLLRRFGIDGLDADNLINLDDSAYYDDADLERFAAALLSQHGVRYPGPAGRAWQHYRRDAGLRDRLAGLVAARAKRNFLVVALAGVLLSEQRQVLDPARPGFGNVRLPSTIGEALDRYLKDQPRPHRIRGVLTALSYAQGTGIDDPTWMLLAAALGYRDVAQEELDALRDSAAADYLLQPTTRIDGRVVRLVRLFHQALIDQLQADRDQSADHAAIATALRADVAGHGGWAYAPSYAIRHLAEHAEHAGTLTTLLTDPAYLAAADVGRLLPAVGRLPPSHRPDEAWVVLRAGHLASGLNGLERLSLLSVTATYLGLPTLAQRLANALPWQPGWVCPSGRRDQTLSAHTGSVFALASVILLDGRLLLASGGWDATVRLWDPVTGAQVGQPLTGHTGPIRAVAAVMLLDGLPLLATASSDATVRLWDPVIGAQVGQPLTGHTGSIRAVTAVRLPDGRPLLATAGSDATVRLWDPATGTQIRRPLTGHRGQVYAAAAVVSPDGRPLLATGGSDATVRLWDLATGTQVGQPLTGHSGPVRAVAAVSLPDGRPLLATGGRDATVRLWDPATGAQIGQPLTGHTGAVLAIAAVAVPGKGVLLASGGDATVRLWDPVTGTQVGQPLTGHPDWVHAVTAVALPDGRTLLASGSDETVRLWDTATGKPAVQPEPSHTGSFRAVVAVALPDGRTLLASGGYDGTVRLWNPATGTPAASPLIGHAGWVRALATLTLPGKQTLLASGGYDGTVRLWDPARASAVGPPLSGHTGPVRAVAAVALPDGRTLLASGGEDATVRLWEPATGAPVSKPLIAHTSWVNAAAAVALPDGRTLLATGSDDATVRLWDPATGTQVGQPLTGHSGPVRAMAALTLPDGHTLLATTSSDKTVRLWDPATAVQVGQNPNRPHRLGERSRRRGAAERTHPARHRQRRRDRTVVGSRHRQPHQTNHSHAPTHHRAHCAARPAGHRDSRRDVPPRAGAVNRARPQRDADTALLRRHQLLLPPFAARAPDGRQSR